MTLPVALIAEKNKIASNEPWLLLLHVDLLGGADYYFVRNTEDVTFEGQAYTATNFDIDSQDQNLKGSVPTITLSVSNVSQIIAGDIDTLDGGIGSTVTLTLVHNGNLTENYSELEQTLDVLGCKVNGMFVDFTLGAPSPLLSTFPRYMYIANHCVWVFKSYECAYNGVAVSCNRTLSNCRLLENSVRFGGTPGLNGDGIRIAG